MFRIGSRGSQLALWQARWVQTELRKLGAESEVVIIRTTGDKITGVPLAQLGGATGVKGLFTKEIEEALLEGRVDLAVHSLKDMPTDLPPGLALTAIPVREDARDAVLGRRLDEIPEGGKVGTSSLRRQAQLKAVRPDLDIVPLRGNLDTRLRKLDEGQFEAVLLAAAGLNRMGWQNRIRELLPIERMCPAVGQGALAIETRADGGPAETACRLLDHLPARIAVTAERALLAALGGGCQVPIGAHAWLEDGRLRLHAVVISPGGDTLIRREEAGSPEEPETLGRSVARALLNAGAKEILEAVYG